MQAVLSRVTPKSCPLYQKCAAGIIQYSKSIGHEIDSESSEEDQAWVLMLERSRSQPDEGGKGNMCRFPVRGALL